MKPKIKYDDYPFMEAFEQAQQRWQHKLRD